MPKYKISAIKGPNEKGNYSGELEDGTQFWTAQVDLRSGDTVDGELGEPFKGYTELKNIKGVPADNESRSNVGHTINKAVALKAAVEMYRSNDEWSEPEILGTANTFLDWIEQEDKLPF